MGLTDAIIPIGYAVVAALVIAACLGCSRRRTSEPRVIRSDADGRRKHEREREHQRRYAQRHHYFWLPCDICGENFGGHESHGALFGPDESGGESICPFCTGERQQMAERWLRALGDEAWGGQTTRWGFVGVIRHTPSGGSVQDSMVFEVRRVAA